ncbi:MAG: ribosome biogenesis GTP-binding protein YihA/YsxC [Bacillota bacterium]|nr:ribosome biogenesis GTP-binding protein YihA/YsxC [Bacillota bacterium]
MKIKKAEFAGCFVKLDQLPEGNLPEIAMVGRSNVGKSSLINKTVNQRHLAKSSSTPGKTRTINYFTINDLWYMVDLPGYGYAKVSQTERNRWGKMIENYLINRSQLKGVIQLLDIRHEPNQKDILMKSWMEHNEIPHLIVVTKADKVSRGARSKHLAVIRRAMGLTVAQTPICFSASNGEGVNEVLEAFSEILQD